jgi:RNA polymerase sigma factor (sigma-70 family)
MDWSELEAVYERYHQPLYRYCFSIIGNAEDAQDALQNAMVKAVRALPGEQREIQLKPWLYRIAHNESIELLRRRREQTELGPELASQAPGPVEAAGLRERLQRLLDDIAQLPERQRGALLMRELGGLAFEEIGTALDTSAAVARQTVYEARLSLGQLEAGREMSCEAVMRELSDGDGRVTRRREIQAHLRDCVECREFRDSIAARRHDLAAIAPLPAAASTAILHTLVGAGKGGAGLGGGILGAGKAAAGSVAVKSIATVAVVAVIGASMADRSGLIDLGGSKGNGVEAGHTSESTPLTSPGRIVAPALRAVNRSAVGSGNAANGRPQAVGPASVRSTGTSAAGVPAAPRSTEEARSPQDSAGSPSRQLPAASSHGQETAASHGGGRAQAGSKAGGGSKGSSSAHSQAPSEPPGQSKPKPGPGAKSPPEHPAHPAPPPHAKGVGPDNSPAAPLQPSEPPKGQGPSEAAGSHPSKEAR